MSQNVKNATIEDGKKILEMLESSPAKGKIELLYTRRPNAYLSYKKESEDVKILKVVENEEIIGTMAKVGRNVYINGEKNKISYLCGLKKDTNYKGNVNWGKVWLKNLTEKETECYICSVLNDNINAQNMAEKKRRKTLNMQLIGNYTTYIIAPYFKFKVKDNNYTFKQATEKEEQEIIDFLNCEGKNKDFFPVIKKIDQFTDLKVTDFYILRDEGKIIATAALWKQIKYRQYIVKKYKGIMRYAKLLNPILKMLGYIKFPKENKVLDFPMLSFFISKNDNEEYYKIFLNNIVQVIKKQYTMFIIGTTQCNFANNIYQGLKNIHFGSKIYSIDFIYGKGKKKKINKENIWFECGLL